VEGDASRGAVFLLFAALQSVQGIVRLRENGRRPTGGLAHKPKSAGKIEDALDDALARDGLGIHVSGGTGLRYSYIDLALTDLERGVERSRRALRKVGVDDRSWIQFFDADLSAEWVGVYPETPPPPSEVDEE